MPDGDHQAAVTKPQRQRNRDRFRRSCGVGGNQTMFGDQILADHAHVGHAIGHEAGDIIVAHQQGLDRHALGTADEFVPPGEFQPAGFQQRQARLRQATRFLQGNAEALLRHGLSQSFIGALDLDRRGG